MGRSTKMNNITSPEKLSRVNPENIQLMNEFLNYLKSVQRSEATIGSYKNDIQIAWVWCLEQNQNKFFVDWTKRNVVAYQNWLLYTNENSPARVRRLKASLSSLSNFVENILDEEYPNFRNIINRVESPANKPVREKTVWEESQLEALLGKLLEEKSYEKACMLALGIYSGRRKAELCRFRVSDFSQDKLVCGGALYKSAPIRTKGKGGGKMIQCYTLAKKFQPYLDLWMQEREAKNIKSVWLFPDPSDQDRQISISTVNSWANTFSRITGENFYWHSLRHAFTTGLAKAGIPDSVIQTIVNWESADMVRVYKDIDADDEIGMYFKNGEISVPRKKTIDEL